MRIALVKERSLLDDATCIDDADFGSMRIEHLNSHTLDDPRWNTVSWRNDTRAWRQKMLLQISGKLNEQSNFTRQVTQSA
ncbi:hypothetical protein [Dokdonella sp.]|uniref:hypothetical protein n=1 Tax=Dokdonella sp. TaxID=2291710 RepID=UPI0025B873D0|nr:hypothetical protein [Dokdonella sp.]MBX3691721.1 hypothetical protein [Dokdonella sp.]